MQEQRRRDEDHEENAEEYHYETPKVSQPRRSLARDPST